MPTAGDYCHGRELTSYNGITDIVVIPLPDGTETCVSKSPFYDCTNNLESKCECYGVLVSFPHVFSVFVIGYLIGLLLTKPLRLSVSLYLWGSKDPRPPCPKCGTLAPEMPGNPSDVAFSARAISINAAGTGAGARPVASISTRRPSDPASLPER